MTFLRSTAVLLFGAAAVPTVASANHSPYLGIEQSWAVASVNSNVPHALAIAPDGSSIYTLQSPGVVSRFDRDGTLLARWGGRPGDPNMVLPQDIAVGVSGAVYVTVSDVDTSKVVKFSPDGALLATWDGTNGTAAFEDPVGITADEGGVYVGSGPSGGRAIVHLSEQGAVVRRLGASAFPYLARDSDGFFYGPSDLITRLTPNGDFAGVIGFSPIGPEPGHFQSPEGASGVAVAADDSIWTADRVGLRVQRFAQSGALLDVCGYVSGPGPFDGPLDVAVAGSSVFVADGEHVRQVGMVSHPATPCDAIPPRLTSVALRLRGGPKKWFKKTAVEFSASEPAHAKLVLQQRVRRDNRLRWRRLGRGRASVPEGENFIDFSDTLDVRPKPTTGRYRIKLRLDDEADNLSRQRRRKFRVP